MARTYTRAEIRTRSLWLADMVDGASEFASTARVDDLINVHHAWLYDKLIDSGCPEYKINVDTVTDDGTLGDTLPADFRGLTGLFSTETTTRFRKVAQIPDSDLHKFERWAGSARLEYYPTVAVIATGAGGDAVNIDGVMGWEELIALRVARDLLLREKTDASAVMMQIAEYEAKIQRTSKRRDRAGPIPIQMVEGDLSADAWPWVTELAGYRLFGDRIYLYKRAQGY